MSKEDAWKEIESAFGTVHLQMCGLKCSCDETLQEVKEALNV